MVGKLCRGDVGLSDGIYKGIFDNLSEIDTEDGFECGVFACHIEQGEVVDYHLLIGSLGEVVQDVLCLGEIGLRDGREGEDEVVVLGFADLSGLEDLVNRGEEMFAGGIAKIDPFDESIEACFFIKESF